MLPFIPALASVFDTPLPLVRTPGSPPQLAVLRFKRGLFAEVRPKFLRLRLQCVVGEQAVTRLGSRSFVKYIVARACRGPEIEASLAR